MIVKLSELLKQAKKEKYGIPAFAVEDENCMRSAIKAAEQMKSPLIVLAGFKEYSTEQELDDLDFRTHSFLHYCEKSSVPIALVRDHTYKFEDAVIGVKVGFQCIMADRSKLPFEENVQQVKEIVKICHSANVDVEAELGHVGLGLDLQKDANVFTVPEEAAAYVEATGCDCLAVSIGNAHGLYKGTPKLDFDLLEQIVQKVDIPLVLHGATGIPEEDVTKACSMGICKINVGTDTYMACRDGVQGADLSGAKVYGVFDAMYNSYMDVIKHWMTITGSAGKAK